MDEMSGKRTRYSAEFKARVFGQGLRSMSVERRRQMIEPGHPRLSIARQCELVSISRFGFHYRLTGETPLNLQVMRLIDAKFLETP